MGDVVYKNIHAPGPSCSTSPSTFWMAFCPSCMSVLLVVIVVVAVTVTVVVCTRNIFTAGLSCSTSSTTSWMAFCSYCMSVFLVSIVVGGGAGSGGSGDGSVCKKHSYNQVLMQHIFFYVLDGILHFLHVSISCYFCWCCYYC